MLTPFLIGLAAGGGMLLLFLGLRYPRADAASIVQARLTRYANRGPLTLEQMELAQPFSERFVRPILERLADLLGRFTPEREREELQARLELAGSPAGLGAGDFQALRLVAAGALLAAGLLILALGRQPVLVLVPLAGLALGLYGPALWLRARVSRRREEIESSLPDALDIITVCVQAGLSFEAALGRVAERFHNALGDEIAKTLREIQLGKPRLEALDDMGRRTGVEDLHNFIQALIQSEQMGAQITRILRIQAEEIRRRRRQAVQRQAAQASLKMLFPMIGCIFPTLWVILLGPALLIVLKIFHL